MARVGPLRHRDEKKVTGNSTSRQDFLRVFFVRPFLRRKKSNVKNTPVHSFVYPSFTYYQKRYHFKDFIKFDKWVS